MHALKRFVFFLLVITLLPLAFVVGGLRLAIENIEYFEQEIEYLLERDVFPGVIFSGLSGDMNRFNPVVTIENISITLPDRSQTLFVDRLTAEFDFWASLRKREPVVLEIAGRIERLELLKDESGKWWSNDIALGGDGRAALPGFEELLLRLPRYLKLHLQRMILRDQASGDTHQLDRIQAQIVNQGDQFFMQFSAVLPERLGRGLLVKSVVGPDRSLVYLNTSSLELSPVARLLDIETHGVREGALDGELWINMSGFDLLAVNGDLVLKNGVLQASDAHSPLAVSYKSRFSAIRRPGSWRITNRFERLSIDDETLPAFRSQVDLADGAHGPVVSAWVDHLEISSLPAVARQWLPAELGEQIAQGRLRGSLRDLMLRIELERPREFIVGGALQHLGSQRFGEIPGIDNVDAEFVGGLRRVNARVSGDGVSVDFGEHFSAPLEIGEIGFDASVALYSTGLVLAVDGLELSNRDISANGRMWMEIDEGLQPFMYLRAEFADAVGASASKYIPRSVTPLKTQAWLDRGIKQGHVPAGELLYHGRLRDVRELAAEWAGELMVDFRVEDAEVFFEPGWQRASGGAGRVVFHNVGMTIDLDEASYGDVDTTRVQASIANFGDPLLEIAIDARAPVSKALATWRETPVGKPYRELIDRIHDAGGLVKTRIDIGIPLSSRDDRRRVDVTLDFEDARARADSWGVELSRINGRVAVTPDSITAKGVEALFFGDPVSVDIGSAKASGATLVNAGGKLQSRNLTKLLPRAIGESLSGASDWQVRLDIAPQPSGDRDPLLRVSAASNLLNTAIAAPAPFRSRGDQARRFAVDIDIFPRRIDFSANLGDAIRSRGKLTQGDDESYRLSSLDLAVASPLRAASGDGVSLYGYLPELSLDQWIDYLDAIGDEPPLRLRRLDLKSDRVVAFGRNHENLHLNVLGSTERYDGSIESSLIKGDFQLPHGPAPLSAAQIELEYVNIEKLESEPDYSKMRPQQLGDFNLVSKAVKYHGMEFSNLEIAARAKANILEVDRFSLRRDRLLMRASAQWKYDPESDSHLSSVSASINGDDLGGAIAGLGFGDTMSGGRIQLTGGFTWPAPLLGVDVQNLVGDAKMRIEDGVLNNVEPGSGRYVGLLSLSALPRRLSLDFSDVLIEGMEFDEITGTYHMENGVLITNDTRMDGEAAKIKITGRTGIVNRDYDQVIRVTPKIRQTLPLIGGVAAGSTVGWGLLLLQNLFKKAIDDAVEVEYRVSGSWDDPKIELLKAVDENQQELPEDPNQYR